jgi:hypothetical protein
MSDHDSMEQHVEDFKCGGVPFNQRSAHSTFPETIGVIREGEGNDAEEVKFAVEIRYR